MFGTAASLINKIKPEIFFNYVFIIWFCYINLSYLIAVFENHIIKRALAGAMLLFPSIKKAKLLIIMDFLDKIVTFGPCKADININVAFIIAFTGFLHIKEIIYPNKKAKDFSITKALYSNIRIVFNSYLIVFYLK